MLKLHESNFFRGLKIETCLRTILYHQQRSQLIFWLSFILFSFSMIGELTDWLFIILGFKCSIFIFIKNQFLFTIFKRTLYKWLYRLVNEKSESQQTPQQPQRRMALTRSTDSFDHMTVAVTTVLTRRRRK